MPSYFGFENGITDAYTRQLLRMPDLSTSFGNKIYDWNAHASVINLVCSDREHQFAAELYRQPVTMATIKTRSSATVVVSWQLPLPSDASARTTGIHLPHTRRRGKIS
jgi:hypothetical protein